MGLLNSIFNSAIRRTVNDVVDKAVDRAFDGLTGSNGTQPQNAAPQQTESKIIKPELSGERVEHTMFPFNGDEMNLSFEKAGKLYEANSGAAEIPVYYVIADSEDEAYADDLYRGLPQVYIGNDELQQGSSLMKTVKNLVVTDVVNHPIIKKKYEYDHNSSFSGMEHCIAYKFYLCKGDEENNQYTVLTLTVPKTCGADTASYSVQALNLIASTLAFE